LLSKIETGKLFPTLPTLLRAALVFGVGLEYFFSGPRDAPVCAIVRREERLRFKRRTPKGVVLHEFECLDFNATERKLNAYLAVFAPIRDEDNVSHDHAGAEFIYVIDGILRLSVDGDHKDLSTGDSVYFDSAAPHSYRAIGRRKCTAIVVTTP
jgi:mannose-6-phosphate isomerase-like protein (cupin superfamily)